LSPNRCIPELHKSFDSTSVYLQDRVRGIEKLQKSVQKYISNLTWRLHTEGFHFNIPKKRHYYGLLQYIITELGEIATTTKTAATYEKM